MTEKEKARHPGEGQGPGNITLVESKNFSDPFMPNGMEKSGYVYIMANRRNGTLYIGVTSNLVQRVWQHRTGAVEGFTKKYSCKSLVWYAKFEDIVSAIAQEKAMKFWRRSLKLTYIERMNPYWRDLWDDIART